MSIVENLKAEHMAKANSQWERAVSRIKGLLNHLDAGVRSLTSRILTAPTSTRFTMFGGDARNEKILSYPWLSFVEGGDLLEGVAQFIEHELLDDGDPGIGYMQHDPYEGFTPCSKHHKDAKPYIHRCVEVLRHTVPEAPSLNVYDVLEILDWYETDRNRMRAGIQAVIEQGNLLGWRADDLAAYEPRPEQRTMQLLIAELTNTES
jgi:hypothetical protein